MSMKSKYTLGIISGRVVDSVVKASVYTLAC